MRRCAWYCVCAVEREGIRRLTPTHLSHRPSPPQPSSLPLTTQALESQHGAGSALSKMAALRKLGPRPEMTL